MLRKLFAILFTAPFLLLLFADVQTLWPIVPQSVQRIVSLPTQAAAR